MVMFGTKCPSITSTWIRSAPPRPPRQYHDPELRSQPKERGRNLDRAGSHRLTSSEIECSPPLETTRRLLPDDGARGTPG